MANLLKKELFDSPTFSKFLADCHQCKLELQQTELTFAAPPSQKSQCRYFNLERLINWATRILGSNVSSFSQILPHLPPERLLQRLQTKFGWLSPYGFSLWVWRYLLLMTRTLEKQVKINGLNSQSISLYNKSLTHLKVPDFFTFFQEKILAYLQQQISLAADHTLLATSDLVESLFGRYKYFSQRCPLFELRSLLLTIPLSTIDFNSQFVNDALTTVHCSDLSPWVNDTFGQSMLSKRKILFSS